EQLLPLRRVRLGTGFLEDRQDAVAQRTPVGQPLHDQRVLLHSSDAEVVRHRAWRDDDVIVRELALTRMNDAPGEIDARDLGSRRASKRATKRSPCSTGRT